MNFIKSTTFVNLIVSVVIVVVTIVLWIVIKKAFRVREEKELKNNPDKKHNGARRSLLNIIKFVVILIVVLAIFQINGINVSALVASLGITGAVIGLALQDFIKDLIMGSHIKTDSFFSEGDVVKYENYEGEVIFFNAKTTKIRDFDSGNIVSICNREVVKIEKVSDQMDVNVGIDYTEDFRKVDLVMESIRERILHMEDVDSAVFKGAQAFENSWVLYKFRFFGNVHRKPDLLRAANRIIQEEMEKADISFAYDHLDVNIKNKEGK